MIQHLCAQCDKPFMEYPGNNRKYCSVSCYWAWQKINVTPPSRKGKKMPNSPVNKGRREWGVIATCPQCEEGFRVQAYRILKVRTPIYCSRECRSKTSITPVLERLRKSKQFAEWRKAVFERDNYTCQHCGERGGVLHPDHIKQFAYYPKLRFDVDNGRTLCKPCHIKTDTYGSKGVRRNYVVA